ncbi:MAG: argininosuccinate lyase [Polyangiaceae bacterium]|nr:argininosuccinate lyase [Polyangiaceae bacterium]
MSQARGGRLPEQISLAMLELNTSVHIDSALWRQDIRGSEVHAAGLARAGVLTEEESRQLIAGLAQVRHEIESGAFVWDAKKEDVHMNIESRLIEICGPVGGKLHTGRSRNDQVATDLRLWTRDKLDETISAIAALAQVLFERAEEEIDTLMPAYTHLQPGQPSRLSHHLMAWQELLRRDATRLVDARVRLNECPLGAGAVAGTGFPLDRSWVAESLGFDRPTRNSIDATGSRDFLMEVASGLAITNIHLSRIGEEVVLWSTQEFGYMSLSDEFSTSSSMMPQKKNPDVAELARGKAARAVGALTSLLVLEKSLCFGYGRDLQEDKRPIFDAFEGALVTLRALTGALKTATFHRHTLERALNRGHLCATDLADALVRRGVPFREAHHVVGGLVREAEVRGVQLGGLDTATLEQAHPLLAGPEMAQALDPVQAVERRSLLGGPAKATVLAAIREATEFWTTLPAGS